MSEMLSVALPKGTQHATNPPSCATASATTAQRGALKALADRVLSRNSTRTICATKLENEGNTRHIAEVIELRRIVPQVVCAYGGPPEEQAEALEVAIADPVEALKCFQSIGAPQSGVHCQDNRVVCLQRANTSRIPTQTPSNPLNIK